MIDIECPNCHRHLRVKEEFAGKSGKCPQCKSLVKVPCDPCVGVAQATTQATPEKIDAEQAKIPPPPQQAAANNSSSKMETLQKPNYPVSAIYVTGSWNIKANTPGFVGQEGGNLTFSMGKFAIICGLGEKQKYSIPLQAIKKTTIDTVDRLPRVTLTRVMLIGVFALAWKKGQRDKFLQIDFTDDTNSEVSVVFGKSVGRNIESVQSLILAARHDYLKSIGVTDQPTALSAPLKTDDIGAKIEQLAALRDKGILTEGEFQAKKSELLARL